MASYGRAAPSSPSLPKSYGQEQHQYLQQYNNQNPPTSTYYSQQSPTSAYCGQQQVSSSSSYGYRSSSNSIYYRSGFIDEVELQQALSSGYPSDHPGSSICPVTFKGVSNAVQASVPAEIRGLTAKDRADFGPSLNDDQWSSVLQMYASLQSGGAELSGNQLEDGNWRW